MECNRDEALRAKQIAERKFREKDIKGAKRFALKAQKIYPELEGLSQMLTTLEVYISSEDEKQHGESNWYGVLGLSPLADDETIRKQYRKLAIALHPDKNRSVGAEGAFQLVSQAWSLLSDKSKRVAYDQRQQRYNTTEKEGSSQNGFSNFASTSTQKDNSSNNNSKSKKNATPGPKNPTASKKKSPTFWTVCHRCKIQYQYLRMYLNRNLLCPNCKEAYFAVEKNPPSSKIFKTSAHSFASPHQGPTRKEEALQSKISGCKRPAESSGRSYFSKKREAVESQTICRFNTSSCLKRDGFFKGKNKGHVDVKCLLMEKAHEEIHKRLNERMPATMVKNVVETINEIETANVKDVSRIKQYELDDEETHLVSNELKLFEEMSVDVPNPEFHDFEEDRTEKCFSDDQVWAVYDDNDGMPRHYAMIKSVISINPFKVKMSWLKSVTHSRLGHVNWFPSGFSKTCGEFKTGGVEIFNSVECFSHIVQWTKHGYKTIRIFPLEGDVWALYRNWSADWNELTEYELIHKYDMVEVLEDYDEEFGVIVVHLVKAAGFKSVFYHSVNPKEIRRIPREEIFRFSHQVPCHFLTGDEVSKGCRELDPAAIPLQFLQVMSSNIEEIEFMKAVT